MFPPRKWLLEPQSHGNDIYFSPTYEFSRAAMSTSFLLSSVAKMDKNWSHQVVQLFWNILKIRYFLLTKVDKYRSPPPCIAAKTSDLHVHGVHLIIKCCYQSVEESVVDEIPNCTNSLYERAKHDERPTINQSIKN